MPYTVIPTALPDVLILEPRVFEDERGSFHESYNARDFAAATGLVREFVQDNHVHSHARVLRGMHYQRERPQGKLVRVLRGEILDVAVDVRRGSATFGQHVAVRLVAEDRRQLWVPEGFAHGYLVTSDGAEVAYRTTDYWAPGDEHCLLWNDPALGIDWPIAGAPVLSAKDAAGLPLAELPAVG